MGKTYRHEGSYPCIRPRRSGKWIGKRKVRKLRILYCKDLWDRPCKEKSTDKYLND